MRRAVGSVGSGAPVEVLLKAHRLPTRVRCICGLESAGEQRLAAICEDKSVPMFRGADGALSEVQLVPRLGARTPESLLLKLEEYN